MWQPTASLESLKQRAGLLEETRAFFKARNILEVDTPVLGRAPVTDPYLSALQTRMQAFRDTFYLQTSPEYYLKRFLAAYPVSCYFLGKCFRDDEYGRYHSPEFTMLEYYHLGLDDHALMQEVSELILVLVNRAFHHDQDLCGKDDSKGFFGIKLSYREAFLKYLGIDPHTAKETVLQQCLTQKAGNIIGMPMPDRDTCLQVLMSEAIEPQLSKLALPVFIYDFPESQAALARKKMLAEGTIVAARFEVYWRGVELGNAYDELTDANEQKLRFEADLSKRKSLGLPAVPVDQNLLAALQAGLPKCAGIALGFDRLLMCVLKQETLSAVQSFFAF